MLDVIVIGDSCQDIFLVMDPKNVHIYGELNKDDYELSFHYADKIPVENKVESVGGNAANAAVSIARLGLRTGLYTHVGDDHAGTHVLRQIEASGVVHNYFVRDKDEETNYNTVINVEGERTILVYHRPRHYFLPKLEMASWVYLTSMKDGFETIIPPLLTYLRAHKVKLCFQPGTFQLKIRNEEVDRLLRHTALFFVNKDEAARYLKVKGTPTMVELLEGLQKLGIEEVVITDGAKGAYAADKKGKYFLATIPEIERVESTGAGDAFASAVTAARLRGVPLPDALRWGLMQASSVIQKIGAQAGLMKKAQLEKMLAQYSEPLPQPYPLSE